MASEQDSRDVLYGDLDLPEWANLDALNPNRNTRYPDRNFAEVFADVDRPILTVSQVHRRLNDPPDTDKTVRTRLNQLVSDGFLEKYQLAPNQDSPMNVYYLRHPEIRDPIPTELSGKQISDLTRLSELEAENEELYKKIDRQEQELEAETERVQTYEQKLQQIGSTVTRTIFSLFIILIPIAVVDALQGVPVFFRALAQPSVGFGLMLIVAIIALYLVNQAVTEALDNRTLRNIIGE